jgi:hypothetical protein
MGIITPMSVVEILGIQRRINMGPGVAVSLDGFLCVVLWFVVGMLLCLLLGLFAPEDSQWRFYGQMGFVFGLLVTLAILAGTLDWSAFPFTRDF